MGTRATRSTIGRRAAVVALLALAPRVAAQAADTTDTSDIPRPIPGDIGLAGSATPDIARFLAVRSATDASPSPDGQQVSYLTSTTGLPQVWAVSLASGYPGVPAPHQLTFTENGVTAQSWSPAGGWIFYAADRAGDERQGFYLVSPDGLEERVLLAPDSAYRVFGAWSPDGRRIAYSSTERDGSDFDVYTQDVSPNGNAGEPRRVFEGRGAVTVDAWRPDGGALVLSHARGETTNDLLLLDLATGALDTLFAPDSAASFRGIAWSPDGRGFYLSTDDGRDVAGLAYYDTTAKALTWIGVSRHPVDAVSLSGDGRWLAWTENIDGATSLHLLDLQGSGSAQQPQLPNGTYNIAWAPHADALIIRVAGSQLPGDVYRYDVVQHRLTRATRSATAGLDPDRFVVPRPVSFPSWDGETIHGLLYTPDGGGKRKPPVLLAVHGGPSSHATASFQPLFQYLLTRGIAVLDLDYRGSTGYGRRYTQLDDGARRMDAVRDMAGALDWLGHAHLADTSRAAVYGASYGGFMAFAALALLPGHFKAGVGVAGVSNWITALAGASPILKATDRAEYGNVEDSTDREFLRDVSPITHADSIRAPLMVIHGANDPRDPVSEADQLVAAVRARGGSVEYLRFPDEGHGIRKTSNRVLAYRRIAAFLTHALLPAAPERAR
ncbi:MAG TPA: S9 family peptidase [Gemmatimonadaceae bacterium]|nr:S9 family peptidase [Gemmatimonadaceae bacterium]